jgi:hypothetical protein
LPDLGIVLQRSAREQPAVVDRLIALILDSLGIPG